MAGLSRRERVYAAAEFREPDRVPICFAGSAGTSITECPPQGRTCSRLYEYLGIRDADPIETSAAWNIVGNVDERVYVRLHSDMRTIGPKVPQAVTQPDGTKTWSWFCGMRIKKVGYYDEPFEFPLRHMSSKEDIERYPWPDTTVNIMDGVVEKAQRLHEDTDYFVVGTSHTNALPFNGYAYLSGMEKWLIDMKGNPEFYHQLAERLLEINLAVSDQFYGGVGKYLDGASVYDDLGTQSGPLMSHADYVSFYKPYTARIIKNIRKHLRPEAKIILHCCGSVYRFIPDLIEIGVDVLNPVQPLARNMEPWRLKRDFGGKIAFLGGLDIQKLLPSATPTEIRRGVGYLLEEYGPGGGYIFSASNNITPDTPAENIVAAFDAAFERGGYPIAVSDTRDYVEYVRGIEASAH